MLKVMRRRACLRLGFLALSASLMAAVVTDARAADMAGNSCTLPSGTGVACQVNKDCAIYGSAVCNQAQMICVCGSPGDMATPSTGDGGGGTGGSGGGFSGGSMGSVPISGGGMNFAPRTGCSYVPGSV
jgi:hypothetical protein